MTFDVVEAVATGFVTTFVAVDVDGVVGDVIFVVGLGFVTGFGSNFTFSSLTSVTFFEFSRMSSFSDSLFFFSRIFVESSILSKTFDDDSETFNSDFFKSFSFSSAVRVGSFITFGFVGSKFGDLLGFFLGINIRLYYITYI